MVIPKGFIPNEDTGQVFAFTEAAQDISFDGMMEHQVAVANVVGQQPYVQQFFSAIGASGSSVVMNTGRIFMRLKPRSERPPAPRDRAGLRGSSPASRASTSTAGAAHHPDRRQPHQGQYQYTLQDADLQTLYHWAPILYDRMKGLPGFLDVNSDLQITSPQVLVEIDREKASALG
jgi:HAE1 family hydrophobic/amphiphilic exporter-1